MDEKLDAYIESLIAAVMANPGLTAMAEQEKQQYKQKLRDHFHSLIIDTLLNRLEPEQLSEVEKIKDNPQALEEKIEEFAASVPNLAQDIEERLTREVEAMKQALISS